MAGTQPVFITADAANQVRRDMAQAQIAALSMQQRGIEEMNAETCSLIDKTRDDVNRSLTESKAASEAHVLEQVGALRAQTESSVNHVDSKVDEMLETRQGLMKKASASSHSLRILRRECET